MRAYIVCTYAEDNKNNKQILDCYKYARRNILAQRINQFIYASARKTCYPYFDFIANALRNTHARVQCKCM